MEKINKLSEKPTLTTFFSGWGGMSSGLMNNGLRGLISLDEVSLNKVGMLCKKCKLPLSRTHTSKSTNKKFYCKNCQNKLKK
jgi:hypothetical protein